MTRLPLVLFVLGLAGFTTLVDTRFTQNAEAKFFSRTLPSDKKNVEFDRLEEDSIYFSSSDRKASRTPLKTGLYELNYLGKLDPERSEVEPYFLFSGKTCRDCTEDRMIFAIRASGGKPNAFVYPGKILEDKNRNLVFRSNAFFGKCLKNNSEDVFVIFQDEKVGKKNRKASSVLVVTPDKDYLKESLIEKNTPSLQNTLRLVKSKKCKEIEGRNRIMANKFANIRIPAAILEDTTDSMESTDLEEEKP